MADAREASATGQVELPAVQLAGEDVAVEDTETGQVGLQVRAAPLDRPVAELDVLGVWIGLVLLWITGAILLYREKAGRAGKAAGR